VLCVGKVVGVGLIAISTLVCAVVARADPYRLLSIDKGFVRWQQPTENRRIVLRYALAAKLIITKDAVNCGRMRPATNLLKNSNIAPDEFRRAVVEAFRRWQKVVDLSFVEVHDDANADIVLGEQADPEGFAYTNVVIGTSHHPSARLISSAQICLNPQKRWKIGFDGNLQVYDLAHTISHEIGHAIGLDHPDERGHLMSFRYHETRGDLSEGDVLGAMQIYGRRSARPSVSVVPEGRSGLHLE
jgi:predicted Zn-dependent protease